MNDAHDPTAPAEPDGSPIGYAAALAELEEILGELEDEAIDIDVLSTRVERAAYLIGVCRARIATAEKQVADVVSQLDASTSE